MSLSSTVRRITPVVAAGALALGVVTIAAAPANAVTAKHSAKVTSRSFYGTTTVTSSKHKKLTLSVDAESSKNGTSLSVMAGKSSETHTWTFSVPKSAVKVSGTGGSATLSKKASKGFAVVKMKVSKSGKAKKNSCSVYSSAKFKGVLYLNTKSAWGKLGSKSHKLKFSGNLYASLNGSCSTSTPCAAGSSWYTYSGTTNGTSVSGSAAGSKGSVYAYRSVSVTKKISRTDYVSAKSSKPKVTGSGAHTVYSVTGKGAAHGKITLRATGKPSLSKSSCKLHGKKHTEKTYDYYSTSVSSKGFVVHASVFGSLKPAKQGSFSITKV